MQPVASSDLVLVCPSLESSTGFLCFPTYDHPCLLFSIFPVAVKVVIVRLCSIYMPRLLDLVFEETEFTVTGTPFNIICIKGTLP